jgi:hypothetical protein
MTGSWDQYQNINIITHQVEWPQGPLTLAQHEEPRWIDAWVVQSTTTPPVQGTAGTGASQSTRQNSGWPPDYSRWTADGIPPGWINGEFQPGFPAVGIALMASRDNSAGTPTNKFFWWARVVVLY